MKLIQQIPGLMIILNRCLILQEPPILRKGPCTIVCMQVSDNTQDCTLKLSDVYCLNRYYGWYVMGGDLETAEETDEGRDGVLECAGKAFYVYRIWC